MYETDLPDGSMTIINSRREIVQAAATLLCAPNLILSARSAFAKTVDDPIAGRSLVFDEPFNTLNPAIWNAGRKVTTADAGHYGRSAFARMGGEEGFDPYAIVDDPAATDGKALQISVKYIGQTMRVPHYYGNTNAEFQWVSGNIQTARQDGTISKGWREGYFEARMWLPKHPLTWPGFWLLNGRSILHPQSSVELDIIEHKGFEPSNYGAYIHEWGQPGEHHEGTGVPVTVDLTAGYHTYGILIDGPTCAPYFDRKPVLSLGNAQPVVWKMGRAAELDRQSDVFFPLITLALLADYPYPNPLKPEDRLSHMRVDYFQVYS